MAISYAALITPTLDTPSPTTRLAPSPTGALHLGNARTFLCTWALARARGWRIVMRIEDLDGPRVKQNAAEECIDALRWLGLDWDVGPIVQSHDLEPYRAAMRSLAAAGLTYSSPHTRSQLAEHDLALSAPQEGASDSRFPPELRPPLMARAFEDTGENWRFATPEGIVEIDDRCAGQVRLDPHTSIGDFILWTKRGQPAYQLAVVVDDARQGITHVVRGNDLIDSAARQMLLYRALNLANVPEYTHFPLVRGSDGRRLAKRHGDTRLDRYRIAGVRHERLVGLLAHWSGVPGPRREMSAGEFAAAWSIGMMPRNDVTFLPEDDAWLCER